MSRLGRGIANERGSAVVLAGVALTAVLGAAAIAVDAAMVFSARAQAQTAADAAALAGASAFVDASGNAALAQTRAMEVVRQNRIRESAITADEVEVLVDVDLATVQVTVIRPAVPMFFARVLGFDAASVSSRAVARAVDATSASCVKPWTPSDPEIEQDADGAGTSPPGKTKGKKKSGGNGAAGGGDAVPGGFVYGQAVVLKGESTAGEASPWVIPSGNGWSGSCSTNAASHTPPAYQANICGCNRAIVRLDASYQLVSGAPGGLKPHTERGVADLVDQDRNARWDDSRATVVGSQFAQWRQSPRVVTVPLHDPTESQNDLRFTRFVQVFVERESDGDVTGRYVTSMRTIQLIE